MPKVIQYNSLLRRLSLRKERKMVRAWYMDNEETDQRLEHQRDPPEFISVDELFKRTGVEYFPVSEKSI